MSQIRYNPKNTQGVVVRMVFGTRGRLRRERELECRFGQVERQRLEAGRR